MVRCSAKLSTAIQRASPEGAHLAVSQGLRGLLCQPEFQDLDDLRRLATRLEEAPHRLDASSSPGLPGRGLERAGAPPCSPRTVRCRSGRHRCRSPHNSRGDGGTFGQVALLLIGPMRMAYATARAAVSAVAGTLSRDC